MNTLTLARQTLTRAAQRLAHRPAPTNPSPAPTPHCNGRHGPDQNEHGQTCEWCDALTSAITTIREQEAVITDLAERVHTLERDQATLWDQATPAEG